MGIVLPAIVLGALGLTFGLVLAYASKKFAVARDERLDQIREALPGANCGACGYPGCDGLASAIVEGKALVNACPVGGEKCAQAIGAIMGVSAETSMPIVARVRCQGTEGNTQHKYNYKGLQDCAGEALYSDGHKSCRFACLGFGNCVSACQFGALRVENSVAVVDEEKCTACGKCVPACPKACIELVRKDAAVLITCRNRDKGKQVREVCARGCISCMRCVKACQYNAVKFEDNLPAVDYGKCVRCGACVKACPMKTITVIGALDEAKVING